MRAPLCLPYLNPTDLATCFEELVQVRSPELPVSVRRIPVHRNVASSYPANGGGSVSREASVHNDHLA